ncbi:MAG: Phage protein gp10 [Akkermansiaceae bacterium]|nr:Phage protein gp10 [Akkermansiaceae bacterium]
MAKVQIKVEGLKELRDRIAKLDRGLQRRVYNKATKAGSKIVVAAAVAKVPVRTGSVKKSITARASSKPSRGLFGVKITIKGGLKSSERTAKRGSKKSGKGRKGGSTYFPDAVERYYRFTELGTKFHPAQPYLKPALEDKKSAVLEAIKTELAAGLERECQALGPG